MAKKNPNPTPQRSSAGPAKKSTNRVPAPPTGGPLLPDWPQSWIYSILVGLALLFYANTLGHDFAIDDKIVYYENAYVKKGFAGIGDLLTKDSFMGYFGEDKQLLEGGRYRPLSLITFAIEHQLWGLVPQLSHAVNVLLYALTGLLLFGLLRRMLPNRQGLALLATVLFIAHPIHVEVVANIKGRDDILGFLFMIGTLNYALRYVKRVGSMATNLSLMTLCFLLGLLSKESSLTYVALVPLTLYFFAEKDKDGHLPFGKIGFATLPLMAIAGAYFTFRASFTGLTVATTNEVVLNAPYLLATTGEKFATIVHVLGLYLLKVVFPHPQSWDYSYAQIPYLDWASPKVLFPLALHLALLYVAYLGLLRRSVYSWCILFYFAGIGLVSNLLVNVGGFMADRFLYQPSLSLCLALAAGVYDLYESRNWKTNTNRRKLHIALGVILALAFAKTAIRNMDWKNENSIFLADVDNVPNSCNANQAAGGAYYRMAFDSLNEPDPQTQYDLLLKSATYYRKALTIYPEYGDASNDIRVVYASLNPLEDQRFPYWQKALSLTPGQPMPEYNPQQAQQLFAEARKIYDKEAPDASLSLLQQSLWHDPTQHNTWYNIGEIYFKQFNYANTARAFQQAVNYDPTNDTYWHDFGVALYNNQQYESARMAFQRTLEINPNHPTVRASMAALEKKAAKEKK